MTALWLIIASFGIGGCDGSRAVTSPSGPATSASVTGDSVGGFHETAPSARSGHDDPGARFHAIGAKEGQLRAVEADRQPERVVAALKLRKGQRVAEVGAGLGLFTFRLARAVGPEGRVVATDVNEEALAGLRTQAEQKRLTVEIRRVSPDDPGLEAASFDVIFLSEVDHYFADRVDYLLRLRKALAPGGRLVVTHARALERPLAAAAATAGFEVADRVEGLPSNYMLILVPSDEGEP